MYTTLNELETAVSPLENPSLYTLVFEIRTHEQSYLNTGQQQYIDNLRLLILEFTDLVQNTSPADLMAGTEQLAAYKKCADSSIFKHSMSHVVESSLSFNHGSNAVSHHTM